MTRVYTINIFVRNLNDLRSCAYIHSHLITETSFLTLRWIIGYRSWLHTNTLVWSNSEQHHPRARASCSARLIGSSVGQRTVVPGRRESPARPRRLLPPRRRPPTRRRTTACGAGSSGWSGSWTRCAPRSSWPPRARPRRPSGRSASRSQVSRPTGWLRCSGRRAKFTGMWPDRGISAAAGLRSLALCVRVIDHVVVRGRCFQPNTIPVK